MNENIEQTDNDVALEPLDTFESAWTSQLATPDSDLAVTGDAFVAATLARHAQSETTGTSSAPSILARIGWMPFAAAAAIAVAGAIGFTMMQQSASPPPESITDSIDDPETRPAPVVPQRVATREDAQRLQLGALIGQASGSFTQPSASLPKTIKDTTGRLSLRALLQDLNNPLPDPNDFLPSRDAGEDHS